MSNSYAPKPWVRPSNYMGATWEGWLVFLGRNRDSELLTNHNFETALHYLEIAGDTLPEGTYEHTDRSMFVVRENHWLCGWVEWIAIHPSNEAAVRLAEELAAKLDRYPVLDEDRFSEREHEEASATWEGMSIRERLDLIKRYGRGSVSILAARHDWIPREDNGAIFEALALD